MMLYRTPQTAPMASLRITLAVLAASVVASPLAAMEEVSVDGTQAVAAARAQDARFRSAMDTLAETVALQFKADLAFDLRQAVAPPMRMASASAHKRG